MTRPGHLSDLFNTSVRTHPDFCGGTIFVPDDIALAVFYDPDAKLPAAPSPGEVAAITAEVRSRAQSVLYDFIFEGAWTWRHALHESLAPHLPDACAPRP